MNFRVIRLHFSTTCEWEQAINGKISEKTQSQCHQFVMALDDNFFFRSRRSALRFPWAKDVLCSRCCRFLWAADFAVRRISCADVTCSLLQESVGGPLSVGHVAQSTCTILEYGSAQGYDIMWDLPVPPALIYASRGSRVSAAVGVAGSARPPSSVTSSRPGHLSRSRGG